jgi:hypothetical protein
MVCVMIARKLRTPIHSGVAGRGGGVRGSGPPGTISWTPEICTKSMRKFWGYLGYLRLSHSRRLDCLDPQPQKPSYAPASTPTFTNDLLRVRCTGTENDCHFLYRINNKSDQIKSKARVIYAGLDKNAVQLKN